mmetsp:Transcript_4152/g.8376  ORF Transcript_4152/g.8376 Transcript_4152/m.8376 type:complete len:140 (-) Transcript_4152:9-428(-)
MFSTKIATLLFVMALACSETLAFSVVQRSLAGRASTMTELHMFGGLKGAFANDDSLGKPQNAGLKNGPNINENVTVNGKPVPGAVVGQKITVVAGRVRVKIPVNCQKGDCGTCMVKVNGRKLKACQTALGSGKTTIETL